MQAPWRRVLRAGVYARIRAPTRVHPRTPTILARPAQGLAARTYRRPGMPAATCPNKPGETLAPAAALEVPVGVLDIAPDALAVLGREAFAPILAVALAPPLAVAVDVAPRRIEVFAQPLALVAVHAPLRLPLRQAARRLEARPALKATVVGERRPCRGAERDGENNSENEGGTVHDAVKCTQLRHATETRSPEICNNRFPAPPALTSCYRQRRHNL